MRHYALAQHRLPEVVSTRNVFARAAIRRMTVWARRAADLGMDALMALAVVLSIPFILLAFGIPVALVVQLLLWIARHL